MNVFSSFSVDVFNSVSVKEIIKQEHKEDSTDRQFSFIKYSKLFMQIRLFRKMSG